MRNISVFLDSNAIIALRIEIFKIGLICPVFGTYYIILYSCKQGGNPKKYGKGKIKMKFYMTHINKQSRVSNSQIATKDGKIVFVRISLMRKAS